jgi:hypothetical protein
MFQLFTLVELLPDTILEQSMRRQGALGALFDDLGNGDPVAWGITIGILVVLAVLGIVGFFIIRNMKKEEAEHKNRYR